MYCTPQNTLSTLIMLLSNIKAHTAVKLREAAGFNMTLNAEFLAGSQETFTCLFSKYTVSLSHTHIHKASGTTIQIML